MLDISKYDKSELDEFYTIPLKEKIPAIKDFLSKRETTEEWSSFNQDSTGIGVLTGEANGLYIVDLDNHDGKRYSPEFEKKLPKTRIKITKNGGKHYYYKYQYSLPTKTGIEYCVDFRGEKSQTVLYPTLDTENPNYQYEIAELPQFLITMVKTEKTNTSLDNTIIYETMENVNEITQNRNISLTSYAGELLSKLPYEYWETIGLKKILEKNTSFNPILDSEEVEKVFQSVCKMKKTELETDFKPLSIEKIMQEKLESTPYLLDGYVVKKAVNVLTGESGGGKSVFALKLVDTISRGTLFLEKYKTEKTKTLYIDFEMNKYDMGQRVRSIVRTKNDNLVYLPKKGFDILNVTDLNKLKHYIDENEIELVVFDTLSKVHCKNENDNGDMTSVMNEFLKLAESGITVLLIHHNRKEGQFRGKKASKDDARGASAIIDNCASHFSFISNTKISEDSNRYIEKNIVLEQHKSRNLNKVGKLSIDIKYDNVTDTTDFTLVNGDLDAPITKQIENWIMNFIKPDKIYLFEEIEKNTEFGISNLRKTLNLLVSSKKLVKRTRTQSEIDNSENKTKSAHIFELFSST
jgi:archaellum biogenesis ATPase FlaH